MKYNEILSAHCDPAALKDQIVQYQKHKKYTFAD